MRLLSFCGSIRTGSYNEAVLALAEKMAADHGAHVDAVRLSEYPMPLYNADEHAALGIPDTTTALYERVVAADAVMISSPEYNGGYTPLLKNTIDWLSRIDKFVFFPRRMGIIAVTPGKRAGANVLDQTVGMLESMAIQVHAPIGIGMCREIVIDGELCDVDEALRLDAWVADFVEAARTQALDPPVPPS